MELIDAIDKEIEKIEQDNPEEAPNYQFRRGKIYGLIKAKIIIQEYRKDNMNQTRDLPQRIERDFTYHAPKIGQPEKYTELRNAAKELAFKIVALTPSSREQSIALTHLEEAIFWANASIARNE